MVGNQHFDPFSVISCSLEDQNWANMAEKQINPEHSPKMCTLEVWIGLCEQFMILWLETKIFTHFQLFFGH